MTGVHPRKHPGSCVELGDLGGHERRTLESLLDDGIDLRHGGQDVGAVSARMAIRPMLSAAMKLDLNRAPLRR